MRGKGYRVVRGDHYNHILNGQCMVTAHHHTSLYQVILLSQSEYGQGWDLNWKSEIGLKRQRKATDKIEPMKICGKTLGYL